MRPIWISACVSALCILFGACDPSPKVIDPFPVLVDLSTGPSLLTASQDDTRCVPTSEDDTRCDAICRDDDIECVTIAVDVLSPISVLDSFRPGGTPADPTRRVTDLTLFDLDASGAITVPRIRLPNKTLYDFHYCASQDTAPETCKVGLGAGATEVFGVLGADIISEFSLRFDFPTSELLFFPDTAGSVSERTLACDAVFETPYGGGGKLRIGNGEVSFGSNRPTLGTCVHHSPITDPEEADSEVGTDMQLAISTGIGPTILSASAYQRYVDSAAGAITIPELTSLPTETLYLLSGPVPVRMAEIAFAAFVGIVGDASNRRGPCRELYANARMRVAKSCASVQVDCPCGNSQSTCKAAAAIEVNRSIVVAVVEDTLPLLQSLRDELRPSLAELDGVIGTEALAALRVDFDYPNNRLLMRCTETEFCTTRPQVRSQDDLDALDKCRAAEEALANPPGQDAGPLP